MARCALLLAHKCRLITGASCVLKNTACTLKAHRGDKQIQRKDSDPRYCHTPRSPASVHCVYRKGQSLTNWIFLPPPHGQWIFTSRAPLTLKASAWRTNVAAERFYLWTKTRGLNAHCRQTQDDFVASKSHQIHARLSCSWCQRADLTELNYSF